MKILLHSPISTIRRNGNRQTSVDWQRILESEGHDVTRMAEPSGERADLLLALHANKSHQAIAYYLKKNPEGKVLLALTGTDIYPEPDDEAIASMQLADGIITLQRQAITKVPEELRKNVTTVIQSAPKLDAVSITRPNDSFQVAVVGHFREVKDPLLTARAASLLPIDSQTQVHQAGGVLEQKFAALIASEEASNPRYNWLGELSETETAHLLAESHLLVVTSRSEGGARVVGEAIVQGTPVLSTRIDGVIGLLGDDYPGFFEVGDAMGLAKLLDQCEHSKSFYQSIADACAAAADQFSPSRERESLLSALERLNLPST